VLPVLLLLLLLLLVPRQLLLLVVPRQLLLVLVPRQLLLRQQARQQRMVQVLPLLLMLPPPPPPPLVHLLRQHLMKLLWLRQLPLLPAAAADAAAGLLVLVPLVMALLSMLLEPLLLPWMCSLPQQQHHLMLQPQQQLSQLALQLRTPLPETPGSSPRRRWQPCLGLRQCYTTAAGTLHAHSPAVCCGLLCFPNFDHIWRDVT
jgi:hypothetical protein